MIHSSGNPFRRVLASVSVFFVVFCRTLLGCVFWISIRVGTSVTIRGIEWGTVAPRTYLGMVHKRDVDPLFLLPVFLFQRGWWTLAGGIRFALRGDGFTRGFLARILEKPAWLARLLRPLAIGPVLRWLGAYPTEGLLRPVEEWIREALETCGDVAAETILAPPLLQEFADLLQLSGTQVGRLPLTRLLAWHNVQLLWQWRGPEVLAHPERRLLERRVVTRIHRELEQLSDSLWQNRALLGAPEGQLSPDGRLSPMQAGFQRVVRMGPPDLRLVPIAFSYDFMTTGRRHVFINAAPALVDAPTLSQTELAARLRHAWLCHTCFTCTQLASGFLLEQRAEFSFSELVHALHEQARTLVAAGRIVDDRLLSPLHVAKQARAYLAYVEKRGLIQRCAPDLWRITFDELTNHVRPRETSYTEQPLLYAAQELRDLLSISAL